MGDGGADSFTIDGGITDNGFSISGTEDSTTIIDGFTIQNVFNGIACDSSGPYIRNVIIKDFLARGFYIDGYSSSPAITPKVEIARWLDYYNTERPHSAFVDKTPMEAYIESMAA